MVSVITWPFAFADITFSRRIHRYTLVGVVIGALFFAVYSLDRDRAFGPFPIDSFIGRPTTLLHPPKILDTIETKVPTTPCKAKKATGVLWLVIDGFRSEDSDASPVFEKLKKEWAFFERSYSPSHSTRLAYAMWMRNTLPHRADKMFEAEPLTKRLNVPTVVFTSDMLGELPPKLMAGDVPIVEMASGCDGEGDRVIELTKEAAFVFAYFGAPHSPYICRENISKKDDYNRYRDELRCVGDEVDSIRKFAEANPDWAIVVTSDHGESLGEKHLGFHSSRLWEEQIHVPTWIKGPGIPGGIRSGLHSNRSVAADVSCWLTGENHADYPTSFVDRETIVVHGFAPSLATVTGVRESAVLEGDWKMIYDWDTEFVQVFDMKNDPEENKNIAKTKSKLIERLKKHLFPNP